MGTVAVRGCLPPGANVCVAAPANEIGNWYFYGYNDGIGVDCHEQYALSLGCNYVMQIPAESVLQCKR